jgi:hypothetical protein
MTRRSTTLDNYSISGAFLRKERILRHARRRRVSISVTFNSIGSVAGERRIEKPLRNPNYASDEG